MPESDSPSNHGFTQGDEIPRIDLFGMPIAQIDLDGLLLYFRHAMRPEAGPPSSPRLVAYANAHSCTLFLQDPAYRQAMLETDLIYTDGNGPRLAAYLSGQWLPRRMTSADWYPQLCEICAEEEFRIFLLGAAPGVADLAVERIKARFSSLDIAGSYHGFLTESDQDRVLQAIHQAKPNLLILGMGSPRQEIWMASHRNQLRAPLIWAAGGLIDYIAGTTPRAPLWMRKLGLEWLGRMLIEPRRLGPRYLYDLPLFLYHALRFALQRRAGRLPL